MIMLDSSFIVAYYNIRDDHHERAVSLMKDIINEKFGKVHISDYIFDETITVVFSRKRSLSSAIKIGEDLKNYLEMLKVDEVLFERAWNIFREQEHASLSFTDCTILAFMEQKSIQHIATFDDDFKKVKGISVVA